MDLNLPGNGPKQRRLPSPYAGALAALAFHDLVALFDEALAFAVLALLLLLDVGASFVRHRTSMTCEGGKAAGAVTPLLRYTVSPSQKYTAEVVHA
jgi:hypothetical protein